MNRRNMARFTVFPPNCNIFRSTQQSSGAPGYPERSGQTVTIVRPLTKDEADLHEVGTMKTTKNSAKRCATFSKVQAMKKIYDAEDSRHTYEVTQYGIRVTERQNGSWRAYYKIRFCDPLAGTATRLVLSGLAEGDPPAEIVAHGIHVVGRLYDNLSREERERLVLNLWIAFEKNQHRTYWKRTDEDGRDYYNCTPNDAPPPSNDDGGYYELDSLKKLKGDN